MSRKYNAPPADASNIGSQINDAHYQKLALTEIAKEQFFQQLADSISMPKNFGKKIRRYHYIPLLDDENINDQGIDANGVAITTDTYYVTLKGTVQEFAVQADADDAAAAVNAIEPGNAVVSGAGPWTVTYANTVLEASTDVLTTAVMTAVPGATRLQGSGNLYGSSKDVGTISGKLPVLSETGGRVNRVGFKRKELEGTFEKFGFFDEYTQESMDFDTDAQLMQHINSTMLKGANEMTEDALQIDLLNSAGVVKFAGAATQPSEMDSTCLVKYEDLLRLSIDLDNNRTAKHTKMFHGTRMIDTRTIQGARIAYIGSELLPTFHAMKDLHNAPAFVSIEKYAAGGNTVTGEVGSIGPFRIVVVPEMMKWSGAGGAADGVSYDDGMNLDVFPILVVGNESFTTIGFQTDGKTVKFKIYHKAPGEGVADRSDPYGETGFMSIKWYYGFMVLRPERLAVLKTVARM